MNQGTQQASRHIGWETDSGHASHDMDSGLIGGLLPSALAPGDQAPNFVLEDVTDRSWCLGDVLEHHGAVVLFSHGSRCPACRRQIRQLTPKLPRIRALGFRALAVSADAIDNLRDHVRADALTLPLLHDEGARVCKTFGLMLPHGHAATVAALHAIDQHGTIVFREFLTCSSLSTDLLGALEAAPTLPGRLRVIP